MGDIGGMAATWEDGLECYYGEYEKCLNPDGAHHNFMFHVGTFAREDDNDMELQRQNLYINMVTGQIIDIDSADIGMGEWQSHARMMSFDRYLKKNRRRKGSLKYHLNDLRINRNCHM